MTYKVIAYITAYRASWECLNDVSTHLDHNKLVETLNFWHPVKTKLLKNCQPHNNFANFEAPPQKNRRTFIIIDNIIS